MTIQELKDRIHALEVLVPNDRIAGVQDEHNILIGALTLIGEARGESYDGRIAVAHTFNTRALDKSRRLLDVCLQPAQYSCWWGENDNAIYVRSLAERLLITKAPISVSDLRLITACKYLVTGVYDGDLPDNTNGATHYLTQSLLWTKPPAWTEGKSPCATIGRHVFFSGIPWN